MVRAAALALTLIAAPVGQQLDLVCVGHSGDGKPVSRRYHVDLTTKHWCSNGCTVRPIAEVNSTRIVFTDIKAAFRGDPSERLDFVDRTNGNWYFFSSYLQGEGSCTSEAFTGFPVPATKF